MANDGPGIAEFPRDSGNILLRSEQGNVSVNYLIARSNTIERNDLNNNLTGVGRGAGGSIIIDAANGTFTTTGSVEDGLNMPNNTAVRTSGVGGTGQFDHDGDGNFDAIFIRANSIDISTGEISSFTNTDPAIRDNVPGGSVTLLSQGDLILQGINFESGRLESDSLIRIIGEVRVSNSDNNLYAIHTRGENLEINTPEISVPDDTIISASLLLGRDTEITTNAGSITMEGDINSMAGENFALTIANDFDLQGNIGTTTPLTSLQTNGMFNFGGEEIITINEQNYDNSIVFNNDTHLEGSTISFTEPVNNNINLEIAGDAGFAQDVTVNSLTISGETNTDGGAIATVGNQLYGDAFNLNGNTTLTTTGGNVTFGGTVDGSHNLTVSTGAGEIRFTDAIGSTAPLNDATIATTNTLTISNGLTTQGLLDINANQLNLGGDMQVGSGNVAIAFPIDLQGDASIGAITGAIQLNEAVTSSGEASNFNLAANGDITTQSIATNGGNLSLATTSGVITTGDLSTTNSNGTGGSITLGSLFLNNDLILASGGGNINLLGTVDGTHNLTVNAGSGAITFADAVGNTAPLNDLNLSNTGTLTLARGAILNGTLTQENATSVNLGGTFTSTQGNVAFNSPLQLTEATAISTDNGNVTLTADVTEAQAANLTIAANQGAITTTNITTNQVDFTAANGITTGAITATNTVNLTSGNGAIAATSIAGTDITTNSAGNFTTGAIASTGPVALTSTNGEIATTSIAGTDITTNSVGNFTTGAIASTGSVALTSTNGDINTADITGTTVTSISNGNLTTGAIASDGPVALNSANGAIDVDALGGTNIGLTATNGAISSGVISANGTLGLTAGGAIATGNVTNDGGNVVLGSSDGAIATDTITTNGGGIEIETGNGAIATDGITSNDGNITLTATSGLTTGPINSTTGGGTGGAIQLDPNGILTINRSTADSSSIQGGDVTFLSDPLLNTDFQIDTNNGQVQFNDTLTSTGDLTINSNGGLIRFNGDMDAEANNLEINSNNGNVRFNSTVTADNLAITAGSGNINLQGRATLNEFAPTTTGVLTLANGLDLGGSLNFPDARQVRLGGPIRIGQSDIDIPAPITLLALTRLIAEGENANVQLFEPVQGNGNTFRVVSNGDITTDAIATASANISLRTTGNSTRITTGRLNTGAIATAGGNITLQAPGNNTTITTEDLTTAANIGGGDIIIRATQEITTRDINTSANTGDGGEVDLDPLGDIQVGSINTESQQATGGDITATTGSFFRATNTFLAANGTTASLSALGAIQGGDITITHTGGEQLTFFNIDNLDQNGTAGAIVTGTIALPNIIPSGEAYLGPYTQASPQGTIDLITAPVTTPGQLDEQPEQLEEPEPPGGFGLEDYFTNRYVRYFSNDTSRILSLDEIQDTLRLIEAQTGVRSAILYTFFAPDAAFDRWQDDIASINPGTLSLDSFNEIAIAPSEWLELSNLSNLGSIDGQQPEDIALKHEYFPDALPSEPPFPDTFLDSPVMVNPLTDGFEAIKLRSTLGDRLGLVLLMADGVEYVDNSTVTRQNTANTLEEFREEIFASVNDGFDYDLSYAQTFYDWLLTGPIQQALVDNEIEHLTFILDHELGGLPVAALHNRVSDRYIIDEFSVNVMPSVSLTDARYVPFERSRLLAMGSEYFDDNVALGPLHAVPFELQTITSMDSANAWGDIILFQETAFTETNLLEQHQRSAPEAIHLATHAGFSSDPENPENLDASFIAFNNERVSLADVRQWELNDPPINLMLLSACETILGNEDAELGFAGVAYQSQITSVLGSLWKVKDWPTSVLMTAFHHLLANEDFADPVPSANTDPGDAMIKAIALQRVQQAFINGDIEITYDETANEWMLMWGSDYAPLPQRSIPTNEINIPYRENALTHPLYWSSFVVVGSPW